MIICYKVRVFVWVDLEEPKWRSVCLLPSWLIDWLFSDSEYFINPRPDDLCAVMTCLSLSHLLTCSAVIGRYNLVYKQKAENLPKQNLSPTSSCIHLQISKCGQLVWEPRQLHIVLIVLPVCSCRASCTGGAGGGGGGGGRWRLRHVVPVVLLWMSLHRHGRIPTRHHVVSFRYQLEVSGFFLLIWQEEEKENKSCSHSWETVKDESIRPSRAGQFYSTCAEI